MNRAYSPSVNIVRDLETKIQYISTPNSQSVFDQILNHSKSGARSFYITGDYGTGKSSFLWAFEQTINKKGNYFSLNSEFLNDSKGSYHFMPIVGSYESIHKLFAEQLELDFDYSSSDLISALDKLYKRLSSKNHGLIIAIDEFGKLLEFASKHNPEYELYFLQLLAEYVNDPDKNILLLTTLHQGFSNYAFNLSTSQKKEWDKVKGRFKEVSFIEPVEQLLFLASERISQKGIKTTAKDFKNLYDLSKNCNAFQFREFLSEKVAKSLLPFDLLSASVLTRSIQFYGQNERSLFSFIDSGDVHGLEDFNSLNTTYYDLSCVYDYLIFNFHSLLSVKYNPHYTQWTAIKISLEKIESSELIDYTSASKLIKSMGLLNIFASAGAKLDKEFYIRYSTLALGIEKAQQLIESLERNKVIRFVSHRSQYVLFDGTDLDIELAINEAGNLVERVSDVTHHLIEFFEFPFLSAKEYYYETGTPRFFEFIISDNPVIQIPRDETDGFINLIFSENMSPDSVKRFSKNSSEAILYGLYGNTNEINSLIYELQKVKKVRDNNLDDKVALKELDSIISHQTALLNHYVLGNMYSSESPVEWFFRGKQIKVTSRKSFNQLLTKICKEVYYSTPTYVYESINKTKPSSQLATARRNLLVALTENWEKDNLGFSEHHFPPEKTIYLTLLKNTGIHNRGDEGFTLSEPLDQSFNPLWDHGMTFLEKGKDGELSLEEFVSDLEKAPFKLKSGFIDVWLPIFLFINRNDYALFTDGRYIPNLSAETLDLVIRKPKDFKIKSFNVTGIKLDIFNKYRELLQQSSTDKLSNSSFIETIKPFLVFYRDLPEYSRKTSRLSQEAISLREAIAKSKDPEKTFFEDFPSALGYTAIDLKEAKDALKSFTISLESSIKEIRTAYSELVDRFELCIKEALDTKESFPAYKEALQERFKTIRKHRLLSKQKVFLQRLESPLDDRISWLQSIAQACIQKSLDIIDDKDEPLLYDQFNRMIHELDNLCDLSLQDIDEENEEVLKLEITSFENGSLNNVVRLPKSKAPEVESTTKKINSILGDNQEMNIAILTKLLNEKLKNDQ